MSLKIEAVFDKLKPLLEKSGADIVKKVGYVYHFEISPEKGKPPVVWTLDLKNGNGSLQKGKHGKADATFGLTDEDAVGLFNKTLNPQTAFMQGKMKIKGNMGAAQKFTPDTFPQASKLWLCIIEMLSIYSCCIG